MENLLINSRLYDYTVTFTNDFIRELKMYSEHTAFVIDKSVFNIYKDCFQNVDRSRIYFMEAVEHRKNMDTVMEIIFFLKNIGVRKDWTVVCFGGGITQDVVTVACNLFLRNVDWHFFPTTLLAMCDSCIGGKCGINLGQYKNQIGVFYPPKKIVIDVRFVDTLTELDYINGWGELLKFSLTSDANFFDEVLQENQFIPCDKIAHYIYKGLNIKKQVIEEDEYESDLRRILNYGHTFGHALEAYTNNIIPHGKGVIWGIDVVNYIAWKENLISYEYYMQIKELIKKVFIQSEIVIAQPAELFDVIQTDKKVRDGIINFAMLNSPSHLIVYPMKIDEALREMFSNYLKETHEYYCN